MSECKKCIHKSVCKKAEHIENYKLHSECSEYKDSELVVVLPCKVGDYLEWDSGVSKQLHQIQAFYYEPIYGLRFDLSVISPIVSHEAITRIVPKEEAEQALSKLQASYEQVKEGEQE